MWGGACFPHQPAPQETRPAGHTSPGNNQTQERGADTEGDTASVFKDSADSHTPADTKLYNLWFDWRNDSVTSIRESLLVSATCTRTGRDVWHIRVAPKIRTNGSPRRESLLTLNKSLVVVLPDTAHEPNRINVFSLLCSDTCELVRPAPLDWIGGIRTADGPEPLSRGSSMRAHGCWWSHT